MLLLLRASTIDQASEPGGFCRMDKKMETTIYVVYLGVI